jgi:diguanylate cyclase (GGDEF)-like protein
LPFARDISVAQAAAQSFAPGPQSPTSLFEVNKGESTAPAAASAGGLDILSILSAVQETAYTWDLASDRIEWAANAAEVLGVRSHEAIATGSDFQFLIAPEHIRRRHDAVTGPASKQGDGTRQFRAQYRFTPGGRRSDASLWIEDHGECTFDGRGDLRQVSGVIRVINERYWEEQRLLHRSDHDELTGQLNRIRLTEALGTVLARTERSRESCCFMMVAVDNMATINDSFGFDVGDEVIAAVAHIIRSRLRGGDSIGRYSSNKFGVILNDCGSSAMRITAERFIKTVRETTIRTSACQLSATISIGGVVLSEQGGNVPIVLGHALQALDKAKALRHDGFSVYEPSAATASERQRNIRITDEVISALNENRMLLALQPIVDSTTPRPVRMPAENGKAGWHDRVGR